VTRRKPPNAIDIPRATQSPGNPDGSRLRPKVSTPIMNSALATTTAVSFNRFSGGAAGSDMGQEAGSQRI